MENIYSLNDLQVLLAEAFQESPTGEDFIKPGFDSLLDEFRDLAKGGKEQLTKICEREKDQTGVSSLKIKYNKVFGYFFEVPLSQSQKLPEYFTRRQTLVNSERFVTDELKVFEEKIIKAQDEFFARQQYLFKEIIQKVLVHTRSLQDLSQKISTIDVLQSGAYLAKRKKWVKPRILSSSHEINIEGGRHPIVESSLEKESVRFVPNSLEMKKSTFHLITGPNMAGKSTFLRQNALIIYLAHLGYFVPAQKADIPLCDQIFTRIGSGDSLATGESTFLLEMQESSRILRHASPNSFVILDEIGRGTSTYDGLSIAWAIMDFLHEKKVKTLFASHYHELIDFAEDLPFAKNFSARVLEDQTKGVIFLHQMFEGGAEKSFGIEVAKLAGFPSSVIKTAQGVLYNLEQKKNTPSQNSLFDTVSFSSQTKPLEEETLFLEQKKKLKNVDIDTMTPLQALEYLSVLKNSF